MGNVPLLPPAAEDPSPMEVHTQLNQQEFQTVARDVCRIIDKAYQIPKSSAQYDDLFSHLTQENQTEEKDSRMNKEDITDPEPLELIIQIEPTREQIPIRINTKGVPDRPISITLVFNKQD